VAADAKAPLPEAALSYAGPIRTLDGGWAAWNAYALTPPDPPAADASPADREAWAVHAGLVSALTGVKQAPPPAPAAAAPAGGGPKKKAGGCN